jgi:hypothetical protein
VETARFSPNLRGGATALRNKRTLKSASPAYLVNVTAAVSITPELWPKDQRVGAKIELRRRELQINPSIHQKTFRSERKIRGCPISSALECRSEESFSSYGLRRMRPQNAKET